MRTTRKILPLLIVFVGLLATGIAVAESASATASGVSLHNRCFERHPARC